MEQDLSEPPSQYVPVIDYEDIKDEFEAKDRYEEAMEDHEEEEQKMEEEEHKLLQENDLNYYDQINITLKCYGDVSNISKYIQPNLFLVNLDWCLKF